MITKRRFARLVGTGVLFGALSASGAAYSADVTVGIMNALTGNWAYGGIPMQNGIRLALEEANANGTLGDVKINIVEGDTAGEKGQAITLTQKFAKTDNAIMIVGPTTSPEATAAAPVANEIGLSLLAMGLSKGILDAGPWSFKTGSSGKGPMEQLAKYAAEKLALKKVVIVYDHANDGMIGIKEHFKQAAAARGVGVVGEEAVLSSDVDFMAMSTKLTSQDIDAVYIATSAEAAANIVVQLKQSGLSPDVKIIGPATLSSAAFVRIAGDAANGAIFTADYFAGDPYPDIAKFAAAYTSRYGSAPDNWGAQGYATGALAVEALRRAGADPDRQKVRDALTGLRDVPTIMGSHSFSFDGSREPSFGAAVLTLVDQKAELAPQ